MSKAAPQLNPLAVDASNGTVIVSIAQAGSTGGNRTAATGTKFDYTLSLSCSVVNGACLTGGKVTVDLSAWKGYDLSFAANDSHVLAHDWSSSTGILTLDLADIDRAGASFTWSFSIQTPPKVSPGFPADLSFSATVSGTQFEPVTSNTVSSHTTAVTPTNTIEKVHEGGGTQYSDGPVWWDIYDTYGPASGIYSPTEYRVITDVLPAGMSFIRCDSQLQATWTCEYDAGTNTVTMRTTTLAPPGGRQMIAKLALSAAAGTYTNTAALDLGTEHKEASSTVTLNPRPAGPNYNAYKAEKYSNAPIVWSTNGKTTPAKRPVSVGTFTGDWKDDGTGVNTEASYSIGFADGSEGKTKGIGVVDDVPCLTNKTGSAGSAIYSSQKDSLCLEPAFYLTHVDTDYNYYLNDLRRQGPDVPIYLTLTDGSVIEVPWSERTGTTSSGYTRWDIPQQYWGRVARVEIKPDWTSGDPKPSKNGLKKGLWIIGNDAGLLRFNGYIPANKGIVDGDTVRNTQADVTFVQDPKGSYAGYPDKTIRTAIDWATTASPHVEADIKIVDAVQGAEKIGNFTAGTQTTPTTGEWTLKAYSQTGLQDLEGPFVTITDLWPSAVPLPDALVTQPTEWFDHDTTTVVASVTPSVTLSTTAAPHKLQWKIPVAVFNTMQHANKGSEVWISAKLPTVTAAYPGSFANTVAVQMAADDNPNPKINKSHGTSVADSTDLDGDPATAWSVQATNTMDWVSSGEAGFDVTKGVKGDLNNQAGPFLYNPARGSTTPGTGSAVYEVNWKNTGGTALNQTVLYDILPYVGDTGVLLSVPRLSDFAPTLTGVEAPAVGSGITVYYSKSSNPCRPELLPALVAGVTCDDDWTTTQPTLSEVKALKWENTNTFTAGQGWSARFTMQAPVSITDPDVAWNVVAGDAWTTGGSPARMEPVEAPKVGIHNSQTGDAVWQKLNAVGNKIGGSQWELQEVDATDQPVAGVDPITVVDDIGAGGYTGRDLDPTPGMLRVSGLSNPARYRLVEAVAPAGYVVDATPRYGTSELNADWNFGPELVNYVYSVPGVSGAATATYNVDYDWSLEKKATPLTQTVDPNTDASIDYTITAYAAAGVPTDLAVSGSATFTNPSGPNLNGTVSISAASGATCTLTNPSTASIAHGGQLVVPFTCANGAIDDDTVTVKFTPDGGLAPASLAIPVKFRIATETDKTIVLTDTFAELNGPRTLNAADIVAAGGSKDYTYTATRTAAQAGGCMPYSNTAKLAASTDQGELTDTVEVEVCGTPVAPTVGTLGGEGSYHTDYDWTLAKTVDQNVVVAPGGDSRQFAYSVTVTPTKSTKGVAATGWVEFLNPNDVALTGTATVTALTGTCKLFAGGAVTIAGNAATSVYFDCTYPNAVPTADDEVTVTLTSGSNVVSETVDVAFTEYPATDQVTTVSDTFTEFGGDKTLDAEDLLADPSLGVFAYTAASHTASTTPGVCDSYPNTASLAATSDQPELSQTVTADLCSQAQPGLELTKTADKSTFVAGDQINYTFVAENTGDASLSNVVISEPVGSFTGSGAISPIGDCKVGSTAATMPVTLAPGEVLTCTASYIASQTDLDQGTLVNSAHVEGTPAYGPHLIDDDAVTVTGDQESGIALTKAANKTKLKAGETVTYKFTATNTGNTTLSEVTITEQDFDGAGKLGPIGGCVVDGVAVAMPATLAPGKVLTCTAAYVVVQSDADRASLTNSAHVEGTPPPGIDPTDPDDTPEPPVADDDEVVIDGAPDRAITLVKKANRSEFEVGDKIKYSFIATNTGAVTLHGVRISETDFNGGKLPAISGCQIGGASVTMPVTLAPGQVLTCTATYVATRADVVRGELANVARVVGTPPSGPGVTDDSEVDTPAHRDVKLALAKKIARFKDVNENEVVDTGDKVLWSFKVTNKGKKALSKLSVSDPLLADAGISILCATKRLAPGASTICLSTEWYVVTDQDVENGRVFNTATASAEGPKKALVVSNPDSTITPTNLTGVLPAEDSGDGQGDLAFTGFAGWSIAIAGGVFALLGAAVLVLVRRRRAGQEG